MADKSDTATVRALLERIAVEKQWSKEDVENDLIILAKNRLVSVEDLKSLSNESWTQIELLPLVKDLLRAAINPNWPANGNIGANIERKDISSEDEEQVKKDKKDKKKKKNKKNIKEFKSASTLGTPVVPTILTKPPAITTNQLAEYASNMSLDTSEDNLTVQNTIRNGSISGVPVEDDADYIISPTTGTYRKKVSFLGEAVTGGSLENNSGNNQSIDDEQKKEKKEKKEKKKEKKKKKELKNAENAEDIETTELTK